jgi:hypothetical protein
MSTELNIDKVDWYNYIKEDYEHITTPTDFSAYIPQTAAVQSLYFLYVEHMHLSPLDAAEKVLEICFNSRKET